MIDKKKGGTERMERDRKMKTEQENKEEIDGCGGRGMRKGRRMWKEGCMWGKKANYHEKQAESSDRVKGGRRATGVNLLCPIKKQSRGEKEKKVLKITVFIQWPLPKPPKLSLCPSQRGSQLTNLASADLNVLLASVIVRVSIPCPTDSFPNDLEAAQQQAAANTSRGLNTIKNELNSRASPTDGNENEIG